MLVCWCYTQNLFALSITLFHIMFVLIMPIIYYYEFNNYKNKIFLSLSRLALLSK